MTDEHPSTPEENEKTDFSLSLDFVPSWARTPPANPYANREDWPERERPGRHPRDRRGGPRREGGRSGRPAGGGGRRPDGAPRRDGHPPFGERRRPEGGERPAFQKDRRGPRPQHGADGPRKDRRGPPRHGRDGERRPPLERMNVKVSFLPDRERLTRIVEDIRATSRAYPLMEIANRFLAHEELYSVKLEMPPAQGEAPRETLAQCLVCKRVFRSRANAEAHALDEHLDCFFDVEEIEVEAPTAEFTCIARCGLSGELLGPPNHHGYNEKIQELWSTRFSKMPRTDYLARIETVRDPALIEKWKDELRRQVLYRRKPDVPEKKKAGAEEDAASPDVATEPAPAVADVAADDSVETVPPAEPAPAAADVPPAAEAEPTEIPAWSRKEAREWARVNRMSHLVRESARCLMPGAISRRFDHPALRAAVSGAWTKESRFPLTLSLALRPAFKHMRLHLFKINARETYVTAIAPAPLAVETLEGVARQVADYVATHPGQTRRQMLEALYPELAPDAPQAAELLTHLSDMIAKGHVIEFFNGTLTLPVERIKREPTAPKAAPAAEASAPEPSAVETPEASPEEVVVPPEEAPVATCSPEEPEIPETT